MKRYNDDNSVTRPNRVGWRGGGGEGQGGNKKDYGDQVSVVCSHGESGSVFVSQ